MNALKTLVMMQLKDKLDLSFVKSKRSLTFKIVLTILKLVIITAVFFALFYLSVMFSVFSLGSQYLPDRVVNVIFTLVQILAIISCTMGLSNALYMSADNKVLLTLPVSNSQIFVSKLVLFYIFELKRNISFTLPMFIAYGIVNHAVWYYYIWLIPCFVIISLIPVVIGALLSIPALYVITFVRKYKWLQYVVMTVIAALVVWGIVALINLLPENLNILGQWGTISGEIRKFLTAFSNALRPFYWLCLMVVGGTLRIASRLFWLDTLLFFGGALGVIAVFFGLSFALARPLFFKMASRQFEYEKMTVAPKKNAVHSRFVSPFLESVKMTLRSSRGLALLFVELALPSIIVLFLNKLYSAMNTNFTGLVLTQLFNILVLLVVMLSFNTPYTSVYSKEANARNILKTRPENPLITLFARISLRASVIVVSTVAAIITYAVVSNNNAQFVSMLFLTTLFLSLGHLLWCAELDVMKSQADQYQTVGLDFDNPNERIATIIGMILAVLAVVLFYLLSDRGVNSSITKLALISVAFLGARIYLYVKRVNLYFVEK